MTIHTDPNAAHAVYAPSAAHRWIPCTASAEAIARLPEQEESEAAEQGTEAHEEIERVLNGGAPDPDHPAAYGVALLASYIKQLLPGRLFVEQRVALTDQIWGRQDVGHWHDETSTFTVADYKNGFIDVDPVENPQLRIYGMASIFTHNLPAKWLRYVIVQPNSLMPVPRVKQWIEPVEHLYAWAQRVAAIPSLIQKTFVAGEHCKYCPLFGRCPASQDLLVQFNRVVANAAEDVPAAQVATFLALKKPIEDWFKGLEKAATKKALAGDMPAGMKLVVGRKHREWKDTNAVRKIVFEKLGLDALDPPSPAQAEKLGLYLETLADKPQGGPALAFESDKRPEWKQKTVAEMFGQYLGQR